uniref:Uncharacterized protein n=1 Tax=Panagrolaimus sp. JU765 TaxID=591449 RepID=A0AC34QJP0_9BILA
MTKQFYHDPLQERIRMSLQAQCGKQVFCPQLNQRRTRSQPFPLPLLNYFFQFISNYSSFKLDDKIIS